MDTSTLTREQLEDRLAALHRASLELVQDISPESLMERIGVLAMEQVGARYCAVGILDEKGRLEKFIPLGMTHAEVAHMAHPPVGKGLIGELMHGSRSIRVAEISKHPHSSGFPAHHPPMSSFLGVPIRYGETQLGQIYLTNKISAPEFTTDDQVVIEMLASYAAVALSNARLVQKLTGRESALTRRTENLALLNEMASTLASSVEIDMVLERALAQIMDYLKLDVGEIFLRQENSKLLQRVLHLGDSIPQVWSRTEFLYGEGNVGQTATSGQLNLLDVSALRSRPSPNGNFLNQDVLAGSIQQIVCLPLNGPSGVFGVLCVASSHETPLDELEMQFLSAISFWVGTAVENMRLNTQQRRLAVLEERERIGMDLHDGIIQDIYAVGLTLEHARLLLEDDSAGANQRIDQAINDLNSTIRDIRAYILDLRPRKLHEENLMDGLRRLVAEFRANTLVEVNLQGPPPGETNIPAAAALALFHICQEALANIGKHAHARRVELSLWTTNERVLLEITDDGRGFDTSKVQLALGHGLANMQTRAHNAGGDLEVSSEPGAGTTILVWLPLVKA
jgi:two-component system sensor histidine kinase DevS